MWTEAQENPGSAYGGARRGARGAGHATANRSVKSWAYQERRGPVQSGELTAGAPPRAPRRIFRPYHSLAVPRGLPLGAAGAGPGAGGRLPTTAMLRNIPNKYMQTTLMEEIDAMGFGGTYDFFYLPMDVHNRANVGYAFINFLDPVDMAGFSEVFADYVFQKHQSLKIARVSPAHIQGLLENLWHLSNRAVTWSRNSQYRPVVKYQGRHRDVCELLVELAEGPVAQGGQPPSADCPGTLRQDPVEHKEPSDHDAQNDVFLERSERELLGDILPPEDFLEPSTAPQYTFSAGHTAFLEHSALEASMVANARCAEAGLGGSFPAAPGLERQQAYTPQKYMSPMEWLGGCEGYSNLCDGMRESFYLEEPEVREQPVFTTSSIQANDKTAKTATEGISTKARLCAGVLIGDFFHNMCDGFFIAAAFKGCGNSFGWGVALSSVLHEIPQELADYIILTGPGVAFSPIMALLCNFLSGLSVILGAILVLSVEIDDSSTGLLLALGGGVYLHIAATECMPRIYDEKLSLKIRVASMVSFIVGAILIGLVLLDHEHCVPAGAEGEGSGGGHHHH